MTYRVIRRLGRGGMGVVDLAVDEHGHEVAMKRLALHGTPDELARARLRIRREAEVLLSLDHPGIVKLREVIDDGDDLVLIMDHLPGGNLATLVDMNGPMHPELVDAMADRLLDALAAAHRRGIIHRDIKPANILFDEHGQAHLADFGAATHRNATPGLTVTEMVLGTPGFMAPEQARGDGTTAASDVFSLGATLAFALTGEGPFGVGDPRVLMLRAASGQMSKLPRDLPEDLRARIESMTVLDPQQRPTAAAARGGPEGTSPRPVSRTPRVPGSDRNRSRMVIGAIAVLAIIAFVAAAAGGVFDAKATTSTVPPSTTPEPVESTTTEACVDLPYRPCGEEDAPNTDGEECLEGFDDYDDDPANGCEAEGDDVADGTELRAGNPIRANIVPRDEVDSYRRPVSDNFNPLGNGTLHIRLVPPPDGILRLTVLDGGEVIGSGTASNGEPLELSFTEPSPGRDDSTTFEVTVELEPSSVPTDGYYELTTRGQY